MNPEGHTAEAVQMQEKTEGLPGQHGAPTVQYTTVNISSEPSKDYTTGAVQMQEKTEGLPGQHGAPTVQYTTVSIPAEHPKDYIIWSLCCFVHLNPCCLGLAALIFSIKARDRKVVGDLNGARLYGSTARTLNICATALVSIVVLISLITAIITIRKVNQAIRP